MKRVIGLLVIFISIIFLSTGIFAVAEACFIQSSLCTAGFTLMGVSDITNAHGELEGQGTYSNYICCNFAGDTSCELDGSNKVIGLSSQTNAHAETPDIGSPQYTLNDVCYDVLGCISSDSTCGTNDVADDARDYPIPVLSLSADTNAHIGPAVGGYDNTRICCVSPSSTRAFWSKDGTSGISGLDVIVGITSIRLMLKNAKFNDVKLLEGTTVTFTIKERDTVTGDDTIKTITEEVDANANADEVWVITKDDLDEGSPFLEFEDYENMEFYFEVSNDSIGFTKTSSDLMLDIEDPSICEGINICGQYGVEDQCTSDLCEVAEDSINLPQGGVCGDGTYSCYCSWNATSSACNGRFSVSIGYDDDGNEILGECVQTGTSDDDCVDGFLTYSWTGTWDGPDGPDKDSCEAGGTQTLQCPAQIQLPFFGFYNFIITMLLVALIYIILISKNRIKK